MFQLEFERSYLNNLCIACALHQGEFICSSFQRIDDCVCVWNLKALKSNFVLKFEMVFLWCQFILYMVILDFFASLEP